MSVDTPFKADRDAVRSMVAMALMGQHQEFMCRFAASDPSQLACKYVGWLIEPDPLKRADLQARMGKSAGWFLSEAAREAAHYGSWTAWHHGARCTTSLGTLLPETFRMPTGNLLERYVRIGQWPDRVVVDEASYVNDHADPIFGAAWVYAVEQDHELSQTLMAGELPSRALPEKFPIWHAFHVAIGRGYYRGFDPDQQNRSFLTLRRWLGVPLVALERFLRLTERGIESVPDRDLQSFALHDPDAAFRLGTKRQPLDTVVANANNRLRWVEGLVSTISPDLPSDIDAIATMFRQEPDAVKRFAILRALQARQVVDETNPWGDGNISPLYDVVRASHPDVDAKAAEPTYDDAVATWAIV